jgi:CheY-like chemotaxis protein
MGQGTGNCQSILIVEDDMDIRNALRDMVELDGYYAETAENGADAMRKLNDMPKPCLIILDIMMPVMNGLEFLAASERDSRIVTVPVVIVTAYEAIARRERSRAAGIVGKPIDIDRLRKFILDFCGPPPADVAAGPERAAETESSETRQEASGSSSSVGVEEAAHQA